MTHMNNCVFKLLALISLVIAQTEDDNDYINSLFLSDRIIGGKICKIEEIPYIVSLSSKLLGFPISCSGTLISFEWILTAAHCVFKKVVENRDMLAVAGSSYRLKSSMYSSVQTTKQYMQRRVIISSYSHEKYDESNKYEYRYDIAVLKTDKPFEQHRFVQPIKLPTKGFSKNCPIAFTGGWGRTIKRSLILYNKAENKTKRHIKGDIPLDFRNPLRCVYLNIISYDECIKYIDISRYAIDRSVICTFSSEGTKDSCKGDSGGPLVCNNTLIALIKGSKGCGRPGVPAGNTNVESYLDWITYAQSKAITIPQTDATTESINGAAREGKNNGSSNNINIMLIFLNIIIMCLKN